MQTKEYFKEYYLKNKDKINKQKKEWVKKNIDKYRKYQTGYMRSYRKEWNANNKDKVKEYNKRSWEKIKNNPKKYREYRDKINEYRSNNSVYKEGRRKKQKARRLKLRFEIFYRDNFTCNFCGRKAPDVELQIDHIFPKSKGGLNKKENYQTLCSDCNYGKNDTILNEFDK